jgi:hypothetical protein
MVRLNSGEKPVPPCVPSAVMLVHACPISKQGTMGTHGKCSGWKPKGARPHAQGPSHHESLIQSQMETGGSFRACTMSALAHFADSGGTSSEVRKVPTTDIRRCRATAQTGVLCLSCGQKLARPSPPGFFLSRQAKPQRLMRFAGLLFSSRA